MRTAAALLCALGGSFVLTMLAMMYQAMRRQRSSAALLALMQGDCRNCINRGFCQYASSDPYNGSAVCPIARALALKERIDRLEV